MNIALYISGHGYGHATRTAALIEDLIKSGIRCFAVTDRPAEIFAHCNPQYCFHRQITTDFGMIQEGWSYTDIEATKKKLTELWESREEIISREMEFCVKNNIDLIISDVPFLPFEVAKRLYLPSCGISNFDWYFIYKNALKAEDKISEAGQEPGCQLTAFDNDIEMHFIIEGIKEYYRKADFAVQLPFSGSESMSGFDNVIEADMLASYYTEEERESIKREVKKEFRLRKDYEIILITYGGYGGNSINLPNLYQTGRYIFAKEFGNYKVKNYSRCRLIPQDYPYHKIMAVADIVITKTGYSTFAEAVKQKKMIIYSRRNGNPEDIVLLNEIKKYPLQYEIFPYRTEQIDWNRILAELKAKKSYNGESIVRTEPAPMDTEGKDETIRSRTSNRKVSTVTLGNLLKSKPAQNKVPVSNRFALIDVGSNNVQLLWAEIKPEGLRPVHRAIRTSALAKDMNNRELTKEGLERAKNILTDYIDFSLCFTEKITVVGTSCSRESSNISILSEWLENEYDIEYKIISEQKEAFLAGLANRKEFAEFPAVLFFDIGGGSTELVFYEGEKAKFQTSIPLGIRRIINEAKGNVRLQNVKINQALSRIKHEIPAEALLVGIGGTVTNISAVKQKLKYYDGTKVHKSKLTIKDVNRFAAEFSGMSNEQVRKLMPFEPERAEIIRTGLLIIAKLMVFFKKNHILVSDYGILFGVAEEIRAGLMS